MLIFIFPIVINSMQVAGDIVLLILAMMGIYVAISQKLSPFVIKEIKVFSYLGVGYFAAVCLSVLFSGQAAELAHYIPRDFYFLFAPFIALALFKAEININYLIVGAKVALLVLGIISLQQWFGQGGRASGVMNAGVFGNLTVSLFFIVLASSHHESLKQNLFTLLSLSFGLAAIIGSGTRGAWLSFVLLLVAYLYFFYKQKAKLNSKLKIIIVLFIILISIGGFNQNFQDRTNLAYLEISNWVSGDKDVNSSTSMRLNMYKKAIDNIEDVPFFGYGLRTSNMVLFKNDSSQAGVKSSRFNHLHNAFLTNYYNGGIVLLGALLLLLFVPLRIFLNANNQNYEEPVFISGALLIIGYVTYGMVNILLGDTYMNGFYVFFLAIFLLLTNKSIKAP
ncbi:O-antigen ligase family protein [Candidatus Thioglobus sp.]|nr:O-antigen ligase family protein [Candidatus Thioglobus sp.]